MKGVMVIGRYHVGPLPDPAPRTNEEYWDCECDEKYIHHASVDECPVCGALRDESPDSHQAEIDEGTHFAI